MSAEAKLISAVCKNKDIGVLFADDVDDIFVSHPDVWEGVKRYYGKHKAVPDVSVLEDQFGDFHGLEVKGATEYYLDLARDEYIQQAMRNLFIDEGSKISEVGGQKSLQTVLSKLTELNKLTTGVRDLSITDLAAAEKYYQQQAKRTEEMGGTPGIPTGIDAIDSAYHTGMAPGHIIYVIGWPGKAKTWFSIYLACKAFDAGHKPMIVSLEMSPEGMRDRIYTVMGSGLFRNSKLQRGDINLDDLRAWGKRSFENKQDITVVSNDGVGDVTPNVVQGKIDQHKPDIVICDYHQLFSDNAKTKEATPRNMNLSKEFKRLAMTNKIALIDITAATSEEKADRESPPMLSQVAWSKQIEYDADMALAVHKAKEGNLVEIVSRKNRHGSDFAFWLDWDIDQGIILEKFYEE